jgi:hypothetical protein
LFWLLCAVTFEFNLGNGFGAGVDKNKPRMGFGGGVHSMWIDGVKQSAVNPAPLDLVNGRYYSFVLRVVGNTAGTNFRMGRGRSNFCLDGAIVIVGYSPVVYPDNICALLGRDPFGPFRMRDEFPEIAPEEDKPATQFIDWMG